MESLSFNELSAVLRFHVCDNYGIDIYRVDEIVDAMKIARVREQQDKRKSAALIGDV